MSDPPAIAEDVRGFDVVAETVGLAGAQGRPATVSIRERLVVHDDAALHLALLHELEGVVELR